MEFVNPTLKISPYLIIQSIYIADIICSVNFCDTSKEDTS